MSETLRLYRLFRPEMKSADLIEIQANTFFGRAIRRVTKLPVNHTMLLLSLDKYESQKNRRYIVEAVSKIEFNLLSERLERLDGKAFWTPLKPEYDHLRDAIAFWALAQKGKKYDVKGMLANLFGAVNQDAKNFYCSELCQIAYAVHGLVPKTSPVAYPGDFQQFGIHGETVRIY